MKSLTTAFNNLKISAKLAIGFAVVILTLMFVGFTGYRGIAHVGEDFEGYAEQVTVVDDISEIDRNFMNYRRLAGEIATHDDAELAKMTHEAEASVKERHRAHVEAGHGSGRKGENCRAREAIRGICGARPQERGSTLRKEQARRGDPRRLRRRPHCQLRQAHCLRRVRGQLQRRHTRQ